MSEFAGNFRYIEAEILTDKIDRVDSFTKNIGLVNFEFEQTYSRGDYAFKSYQRQTV